MVSGKLPAEQVAGVVSRGLETLQSLLGGVTDVIRAGDSTVKELDGALTGRPSAGPSTPEQSFLEVVALMQGAVEEARETGSATSASVVQRAREVLGRATRDEPSWRPGPSLVRTANDVFRTALRDLRASQNLLKLAQGNGSLNDLEQLSGWAEEVTDRLRSVQAMVKEPKPGIAAAEATPVAEVNPAPAAPAPAPAAKTPRKRNTTPKAKGSPEEIAFAQAVAEELGDTKVKGWAQEFADGKISEKQWVSRLTGSAAAKRDSLDDVFDRAQARMTRDAGTQ